MDNQVHSHADGTQECQCNHPARPAFPASREVPEWREPYMPHTHTTNTGKVVECYHECRSTLSRPSFWVLTTLVFPLEHAIWVKIPMLHAIAAWAGL